MHGRVSRLELYAEGAPRIKGEFLTAVEKLAAFPLPTGTVLGPRASLVSFYAVVEAAPPLFVARDSIQRPNRNQVTSGFAFTRLRYFGIARL